MVQIRTPAELGLIVRDRRRQLGLDQATLADRTGVSRQWVVEVEGGKPRAEVGLILRLLRALELDLWCEPVASRDDLDAILDRTRDPSPGSHDD